MVLHARGNERRSESARSAFERDESGVDLIARDDLVARLLDADERGIDLVDALIDARDNRLPLQLVLSTMASIEARDPPGKRGGRGGGDGGEVVSLSEARARRKERDKERRAEKRREARKIVGVDGEGEDRVCGECNGCDPIDPDAPRQCLACKGWMSRSAWPNRRCPQCNASACLTPRHIYTYLAAVDEDGQLIADAHNPDGLSHNECCEMLLSLPKECLCFGYMFSYDVTKIIEQMPASERFYLMRPKLREIHICNDCGHSFSRFQTFCPECASESLKKKMQPLRYGTRSYDFFNGSLTLVEKIAALGEDTQRRTKVWDCFRFFGCAFVEALKGWNVGTEAQVEQIAQMKQKRGAFDVEDPEAVKKYCQEECHLLAIMMRRVIEAHDQAGIPLTRFEGAGSTATALLRKFEVAAYKGDKIDKLDRDLAHAIACAFFGGRFEDSCVGILREPVHGYDISSAYPFALTSMPCLNCGRWRYEKRTTVAEIRNAGLALVRFRVKPMADRARRNLAWGPLPYRDDKGSIAYGVNFTGWAWGPEILSALAGWPDIVEIADAWIYDRGCDDRPFGFLPPVYRERLKWGKEGAGIALKLGMNASYGKTAQSVGDDPPFQSWIWAGMTTAVTRALLNEGICSAANRWNVRTLATDGIYATEPLKLWHRRTFDEKSQKWSCECFADRPIRPLAGKANIDCNPELFAEAPRDTGTGDLPKPLGGWEHKYIPEGVFVAKPGLYWRLLPPPKTRDEEKKQLAELRARGIGRRELINRDEETKKTGKELLEEGFMAWDRVDPKFGVTLQSRRFYGAKNSVNGYSFCGPCKRGWSGVPEQRCPKCNKAGTMFEPRFLQDKYGKDAYGRWGARDVKVSFDPYPKREREGISRDGTAPRLFVRDLDGGESAAYPVGMMDPVSTPEGMSAREAREFQLEQPDWDEPSLGGAAFGGEPEGFE